MNTNQIFAHTEGIVNWSEKNKIHLVGHSLGAQTIRYFQHLLKIGYFEDEYKGVDRSNWIASINCISPPFNGATVTHNFGFNPKTNRFYSHSWAVKLLKYKVITANLLSNSGTQNKANEIILNSKVRFKVYF
jgi:triacylglycerol esterase/lipase EstA (alpha/beta hydrolase family)